MYTFDKLAAKEVAKKDAPGSKALNEYLFLKPHDGPWYEDPRLQAGAGAGLGALGGGLIGKQLGGNTGAIIGAGLGGLAGGYGGYAYGPAATKKLAQVGKKTKEKVGEVSEKAKAKRKEQEAKVAAYYDLNQEWFNIFDRLADKKASAQDKIASPVTEPLRSLFAAHPVTTGVGLGALGGGLVGAYRGYRNPEGTLLGGAFKGSLLGGSIGGTVGAGRLAFNSFKGGMDIKALPEAQREAFMDNVAAGLPGDLEDFEYLRQYIPHFYNYGGGQNVNLSNALFLGGGTLAGTAAANAALRHRDKQSFFRDPYWFDKQANIHLVGDVIKGYGFTHPALLGGAFGAGTGALAGGLYNWRTKRPVWKGALTGGLGGGVLGAGAGTIASVPALQYLGKEYGFPIDIGM